MLSQALEAARCWEEGVLSCAADGDVGAVLGLGCAVSEGGPLAWLERRGPEEVARRARAWVARGAVELAPPALLAAWPARG
ncbi:MAG: hypothetical protein FJ138_17245 [Deltaproteobacteria bacterium]|nr:hypothetical protein [Deltaproteobacteria bacterium]